MPVFSRNNDRRVDRAKQLIGSISSIQAEMEVIGRLIDEVNPWYRPALNKVLKANDMKSVDEVVSEATAKITKCKKDFEGLIQLLKNIERGLHWGYLVSALLIARGLFGHDTTFYVCAVAVVIARRCWKVDFMKARAHVVSAQVATCVQAAAEGLRLLTSELEQKTSFLQEATSDLEMNEYTRMLIGLGIIVMASALGIHTTVESIFGLVVGALFGLFDILIGADQKKKLVETIHELQELRLEMAFQKFHLINIQSHLELVWDCFDSSPRNSIPDPTSKATANLISAINYRCYKEKECLHKLQSDLEKEDHMCTMFYGEDDYENWVVVMCVEFTVNPSKFVF